MIEPVFFLDEIKKQGINFFCGVPDSLLKHFCFAVTESTNSHEHIIAANEGNAIALAAGHFLATGKPGLVYMQNSGLGNSVNPLLSLTDRLVYSIPMLLLIGWRGEPGIKDEPQHLKQGQVTPALLEVMGITSTVLPQEPEDALLAVKQAIQHAEENAVPVALLVKKGIFSTHPSPETTNSELELSREDAIQYIVKEIDRNTLIVSTTGAASRELFEFRLAQGKEKDGQDFLCVGSMGHASQIALGIALAKPSRHVICFDGDGALLMHMGGLAIIGSRKPENFYHILLNNSAHDSVGAQPTVGFQTDISAIAKACGYRATAQISSLKDITNVWEGMLNSPGPAFLEIRVRTGMRKDLGRPTITPIENQNLFIRNLRQ